MKIMDRFWSYYFLNPVAWVFLAFFVMAEYQSYITGVKLNTVCEAVMVPVPDVHLHNPMTVLEKAQVICEDRRDTTDPISGLTVGLLHTATTKTGRI